MLLINDGAFGWQAVPRDVEKFIAAASEGPYP
jgi:hypothetical protein